MSPTLCILYYLYVLPHCATTRRSRPSTYSIGQYGTAGLECIISYVSYIVILRMIRALVSYICVCTYHTLHNLCLKKTLFNKLLDKNFLPAK